MNFKKLFLFLAIGTQICFSYAATHRTVVHVFVHGTRFAWLAALSVVATYRQRLDGASWYTRAMYASRANPLQFDAEIMQEPGLHEITAATMTQARWGTLAADIRRRAAVQAITAYDSFLPDDDTVTNKYYTFGWSGMLSIEERKKAGEQLYDELIALRDDLRAHNTESNVIFIVHGHSHGGNVVLNLAHWETEKHRELHIAYALLYCTPLQIETIDYAQSPVFEKIISFYSPGDSVQVSDWVSTSQPALRKNRRLADFFTWHNTPENYRLDVCICLNGNQNVFNHTAFFWMDDTLYRANPQCEALRPLPIVAFAPKIMALMDRLAHHNANAQVKLDAQTRTGLVWSACTSDNINTETCDVNQDMRAIKQLVQRSWNPTCPTKPSIMLHMAKELALAPLHWLFGLFSRQPAPNRA